MQGTSWSGAAAIALLLAGCGGNLDNSQPGSDAVSLATPADALRELGNTAYAASLLQSPSSYSCTSGAATVTSSGSTTRSFVYFTEFTGTVNYAITAYSDCVDSSGVTVDGDLEAGASSDSSYSFAIYGSPNTAVPLILQSSGTSSSGSAVNIAQSLLGTIETHLISSTQSEFRSGLETASEQTPQSGGGASYQGSFSIGVQGPTFDLISDSSGGTGSETIAGNYSYSSSLCSGGSVTLATPTASPLLLSPSASGSYPTGGALTLSSGANAVTYTFSASGASLSGSISGSLSSAQVQQAFGSGSGC